MLERERPLRRGPREPGDPPRQLRLAVRGDEARGSARAPRRSPPGTSAHRLDVRDGRRREVDRLEQPVDRVADLRRGQARRPAPCRGHPPAACRRPARRSSGRSSGRRARARCRRAAHAVERRRRDGASSGSRGAGGGSGASSSPVKSASWPSSPRRPARAPAAAASARAGGGRRERAGARRRGRARPGRRPAASSSCASRRAEHPPDRRRLVGGPARGRWRPRRSAVDRPRHGDVVEAEPLGALGLALGLPHLLVLEGGPARAGGRVGDPEAEAPVRQAEDLVGRGRVPVAARRRRRSRP